MKKTHWRGREREKESTNDNFHVCKRHVWLRRYGLWVLIFPYLIHASKSSLSLSLSLISFCQIFSFFLFLTFCPNLIGRDKQIFARHSTLSLINLLFFNYFFFFSYVLTLRRYQIPLTEKDYKAATAVPCCDSRNYCCWPVA